MLNLTIPILDVMTTHLPTVACPTSRMLLHKSDTDVGGFHPFDGQYTFSVSVMKLNYTSAFVFTLGGFGGLHMIPNYSNLQLLGSSIRQHHRSLSFHARVA